MPPAHPLPFSYFQAPEAQEPDDSALTDVITNLRSRNQDLVARMQELQAEQERQVEANHRLRQELQEVTAENVRLTGRIAGIEAGLVRTRAELAEREVELRKARKKGWFSSK